MSNGAGKGSRYRPADQKKYAENYDRIFRKKDWFCTKVLKGSDHCDFCKHNEKATETHTTLYCPITGVEPNKEKCTDEHNK